jgi:hypothetical protein
MPYGRTTSFRWNTMGCVVVNCVVETAAIKTAVSCSEEVLTGGSGRAVLAGRFWPGGNDQSERVVEVQKSGES